MSRVRDTLTAARALCAAGWTQGVAARDASDNQVGVDEPCAAKFCMVGAVYRVAHDDDVERYALNALGDAIGGGVARFNDHRATTQADVLRVFDSAIGAAS